VIIQFPWDHGGSKLLHRLGGKPKLKKGGMSGTTHGCTSTWAISLGLLEQVSDGSLGIIYKRTQGQQEGGSNNKQPNSLSPSSGNIFLSSLLFFFILPLES